MYIRACRRSWGARTHCTLCTHGATSDGSSVVRTVHSCPTQTCEIRIFLRWRCVCVRVWHTCTHGHTSAGQFVRCQCAHQHQHPSSKKRVWLARATPHVQARQFVAKTLTCGSSMTVVRPFSPSGMTRALSAPSSVCSAVTQRLAYLKQRQFVCGNCD